MKLYLNGLVLAEEEAVLPVQDRGVLFGDGLFETVRVYSGRPFRLARHLDRLRLGCEILHIALPTEDSEIEMAIIHLYRENVGAGDAYVRVTLTGGAYDGGKRLDRPGPPNLFIIVKPYEGYPEEYYRQGMRLVVANARRNSSSPLTRIKCNNYLDTLMAKQEAWDRGADDAVFLNEQGHITEASTANIFWVRRGSVFTPEVGCGLLPGITREAVQELCEQLGLHGLEGRYLLPELCGADEAFLTVSTGEIVPVASVDGHVLEEPHPGPVTTRLSNAYHELVKRELGL